MFNSQMFLHQLMNKCVLLNMDIKIYIKTAPTYFGVITILRESIIWACLSYIG
jgi:hypothetical protein